jgi:hypothetical protein
MKSISTYWATILLILVAGIPSYAQMECKCHSKQPAMKHMHETIGFSGCGNCHTKNENLMSIRGRKDPDMKTRLATRIKTDNSCIPCHDSEGSVRKEVHSGDSATDIAGTLYCPKDKIRFSSGTESCSKCGGVLINISEVMERSRENPSNGICSECHRMEEVQQISWHTIFNSTKLKRCLDCHEGHDDCGSCHQ